MPADSLKLLPQKLNVSEGTIKNRVTRLKNRGILKLEARVNPFALPNAISALVGVNLKERDHEKKIKEIEKIPAVTAVWNATGRFDLFFEVMVDSLNSLNDILFREDFRQNWRDKVYGNIFNTFFKYKIF